MCCTTSRPASSFCIPLRLPKASQAPIPGRWLSRGLPCRDEFPAECHEEVCVSVRSRPLNVRFQGLAALGLAAGLVAVIAVLALTLLDGDQSGAASTPTAIALITALPTANDAQTPLTGQTPATTGSEVAQETTAATPAATPIHDDEWGAVIDTITDDKTAQMFRGSISRTAEYSGPAINAKPDSAWSTDLGGENYSVPVVAGDKVIVGGNDATLKCLDIKTGEELWQAKAHDDISSSPAVGSNRVFVGSF